MQLVITGPDAASKRIDLKQEAVTIGRAPDNVLSYPNDPALSRYHLSIEPADGGWRIRDCGSRNGTVVNSITVAGPQVLQAGDRIYAGQLTLEVVKLPTSVSERVVTFSPPEAGKEPKRSSTIITSLEEVLGKARSDGPHVEDSTLATTRAVSALIRAGQELAGHRPLEELFNVILELALSAVSARRGVILTEDPDGELRVRANRGEEFSISSSVRQQVVRERKALLISDAQLEEALRNQQSIVTQRVRSIVAVPLQTDERVIGLIYVDNGTTLRPFSQADLELLTVMSNVAAIRIEHARLALIEQQEKLTQLELSQASEIQRELLPSEAPEVPGYEIAGFNVPCRTVGGDYFDFLPYQDGRLGICVADVCGKGLPAALMMSSLQARVHMLAESAPDAAPALNLLNRNLASRFPLGRFITAFLGVLEPRTGVVQYANAGHNLPLLLRATGDVDRVRGGGLVLGLQSDVVYTQHNLSLDPGETLILYSDGVTEAASARGEQFGERRLAEFFGLEGEGSCVELVQKLMERVRAWTGATAFADDFTIVLVRRSAIGDTFGTVTL